MLKANGKGTPDAAKPTPHTLESAVGTLSATTDRTMVAESREDAMTKGTKRGRVQFDARESDEEKQSSESKRADLRDQRVAASTAKRLVHFISDMAKDPEEVQTQVTQRCFLDSTLEDFLFEAELTPHRGRDEQCEALNRNCSQAVIDTLFLLSGKRTSHRNGR
ncbi:hypothetical protein K4K48_002918 [Colletotrichum sp. SAR 10_66]|nr:hypothetical protein K4K48_002918 [Colletotrichum sp. SAR 10_66]